MVLWVIAYFAGFFEETNSQAVPPSPTPVSSPARSK